MIVHVICCNDDIRYAVVEDEKEAQSKLAELREEYYFKNRWNFRDREGYDRICYWHIHTVEGK